MPVLESDANNENNVPPSQQTVPQSAEQIGLCVGCSEKIFDRYYLVALDKQWHITCLRCHECKEQLDSQSTCFTKDGLIYCRDDYYSKFAQKYCSGCAQIISSNELVMRARDLLFHIQCFVCAHCQTLLHTGDQFGLKNNLIYCKQHYEMILNSTSPITPLADGGVSISTISMNEMYPGQQPILSTSVSDTNPLLMHPLDGIPPGSQGSVVQLTSPNILPGMDPTAMFPGSDISGMGNPMMQEQESVTPQKRQSRKKKNVSTDGSIDNSESVDMCQNLGYPIADGDAIGPDGFTSLQRQKRMRTSFKHHQLKTMKMYFSYNHNPDAKDLKQLAQKTGLSKRVLQVWFQNARAKHRRHQMKSGGVVSGNGLDISDNCSDSGSLLDANGSSGTVEEPRGGTTILNTQHQQSITQNNSTGEEQNFIPSTIQTSSSGENNEQKPYNMHSSQLEAKDINSNNTNPTDSISNMFLLNNADSSDQSLKMMDFPGMGTTGNLSGESLLPRQSVSPPDFKSELSPTSSITGIKNPSLSQGVISSVAPSNFQHIGEMFNKGVYA